MRTMLALGLLVLLTGCAGLHLQLTPDGKMALDGSVMVPGPGGQPLGMLSGGGSLDLSSVFGWVNSKLGGGTPTDAGPAPVEGQ